MKLSYLVLIIAALLVACSDDSTSSSQFILINNVNKENSFMPQGNFSLYTFPGKTFTEQFFTIDEDYGTTINAATLQGNYVYITNNYWDSKLRKIDINTGVQVKETPISLMQRPFLDTHQTNVLMTSLRQDPIKTNTYYIFTNIYDENLKLLDSLTIEETPYSPTATKVINNKLFYCLDNSEVKVLDLSTQEIIKSITLPNKCSQFIDINSTQLLAVHFNGFSIIDVEKLEITKSKEAYLGQFITKSSSENTLFYLSQNAQPATSTFSLSRYDINTGQSDLLYYGVSEPIAYDSKTNVILTGNLRVFSPDGTLLDSKESPQKLTHILIK